MDAAQEQLSHARISSEILAGNMDVAGMAKSAATALLAQLPNSSFLLPNS
ncbi:MAG: hypothetical protein KBT11_05975 [Treponema sp.]|nr:hypothetical protein [Candidatus Treponema equifaecale]